jgi:hypothetical protein
VQHREFCNIPSQGRASLTGKVQLRYLEGYCEPMSKGKLEFFSLVGSYRGKQFFPLTLVLREISNKDN